MRGLMVDEGLCLGCRACASACTPTLISLREADGFRYVRFPGTCQEDCSRCREVCPRGAISFIETDQDQGSRELAFVLLLCDRCGRPIAPEKALAHVLVQVRQSLTTEETPWLSLCLSCRREQTAAGLLEAL